MEHVYTVYTKIIDNKTYYFVKKMLVLSEFKGLADVVVGYGMHTDFEKACSIAGVPNTILMQQLLLELEERNHAELLADRLHKTVTKHNVKISDSVNRRLVECGAELLN